MRNGKTLLIVVVAFISIYISFKGCSSDDRSNQQVKYEKSPVDIFIRDLAAEDNFSIILFDMDYTEQTDTYKHKYNVLIGKKDSVHVQNSEWVNVSSIFFNANMDNMGMEIASKKDGKVSKATAPAGYSNYVGNDKYGQWRERDGNRFWEFYGKYALMSSMFRMSMYPVRYSYWNNYHSNYYASGRSYYGPTTNGRNMYGTNSNYTQSNTNSAWNKKPANFKSSVRSKVSRSVTASKNAAAQRSRNSSRYSSSGTRSRGSGFGK